MSEAERLARTLAAVHDDLSGALGGSDELLRGAVETIAAEIRNTPGLRLRVALAAAAPTDGPGWPD
jgi:hypothetical protein